MPKFNDYLEGVSRPEELAEATKFTAGAKAKAKVLKAAEADFAKLKPAYYKAKQAAINKYHLLLAAALEGKTVQRIDDGRPVGDPFVIDSLDSTVLDAQLYGAALRLTFSANSGLSRGSRVVVAEVVWPYAAKDMKPSVDMLVQ
jgi:hypothetical protein